MKSNEFEKPIKGIATNRVFDVNVYKAYSQHCATRIRILDDGNVFLDKKSIPEGDWDPSEETVGFLSMDEFIEYADQVKEIADFYRD